MLIHPAAERPVEDEENDTLDPAMEEAQIRDMFPRDFHNGRSPLTPPSLMPMTESAERRTYNASIGDDGSCDSFFTAAVIDVSGSGHMAVFTHLYDGIGEDEYEHLWMSDPVAIDAHIQLRYAQWCARIA